jgi:hypothetical protein
VKNLILVPALAALFLMTACERGGEIIVAPGEAPGVGAPTYEVVLFPGTVPNWVDSSFFGFAGPQNATFLQIENGTDQLVSRGLTRFGFLEDSAFIIDTVSAALRFDSARVVFTLDSTRTVLASTGTTLQIVEILQEWDRGSANWGFAVDSPSVQEPWTAGPGGSFGAVLGDTLLTWEGLDASNDSVVIWLDVDSDSLLKSWLDTTQVNTGLGVLVGDSGAVVLQLPRIHYELIPEVDPDTSIEFRVFATDGTFIFDRMQEGSTAGIARVGGVDGWRAYTEIVLPDSVDVEGVDGKVLLRGATINKAQVFLVSHDPPDPPFAADQVIFTTSYDLVDDFTVLGAKTPVGNRIFGSDLQVDVDSLVAGDTLALNLTGRIQQWALEPLDSIALPVRFTLRALPEATTFGYWEFGGADDEPQFRPVLRIVFTQRTEFLLP